MSDSITISNFEGTTPLADEEIGLKKDEVSSASLTAEDMVTNRIGRIHIAYLGGYWDGRITNVGGNEWQANNLTHHESDANYVVKATSETAVIVTVTQDNQSSNQLPDTVITEP